jgi:hypothetical protein
MAVCGLSQFASSAEPSTAYSSRSRREGVGRSRLLSASVILRTVVCSTLSCLTLAVGYATEPSPGSNVVAAGTRNWQRSPQSLKLTPLMTSLLSETFMETMTGS